MPIYEYRCAACGFQKEHLQKVDDAVLTACPQCGQESYKKLLSAAGFQLKGSGWYATDFRGGNEKKGAAKEAEKSALPPCQGGEGACPSGACAA
ncbi:MAG: zinc ribbon domain-containing protein [Zoogloeaceae bacterium]|jgi:putative FmdB family regulatory protein|nr:zinc ribbon domain-containing protein [Zoogloeaceae bacterium]